MPSSATATGNTVTVVGAANQQQNNAATKIRQQSIAQIKQEELLSAQTSYYIKPEEMKLTQKEKFQKFLWDPQTKRFFGRSGSSWTLDSRIPKWQLDGSLIGTNPGLGFRPMPIENPDSTLIWLQGKNISSHERWANLVNDFLDDYYTPGKSQKGTTSVRKCSYSNPPLRGEVCSVEVKNWDVCSKANKYMYHKNSPCIFLKLNKIYGWTPQYYLDPSEFPENMPTQLKEHIMSIKDEDLKRTVWITCEGEGKTDAQNIGPIKYYPDIQGFPGYYYPYENSEGYLSPLIAVHFERPKCKLGSFYLIFYTVLVALFAICMWVFFQTLDPRIPKCQMEKSVIGTSPGLGFRPMPDDVESTLIWLESENKTFGHSVNEKWSSRLDKFLDTYYAPGKEKKGSATGRTCNYNDNIRIGEVCTVDVTLWKECSKDNKYMYHKSTPCVFLKLNKIYGWTPHYIRHRNEFPPDMPKQLQHHIETTNEAEKNTVWVSCEGETPTDVEYLGPVKYYPSIQGFPGYYFPYVNSEGYLSPLVAVHFVQPKQGIVINVECKAWAKNIVRSRTHRLGSVHFELMIGGHSQINVK
ncbi:sodium/potassium-dependent atpase beta subunit [Holotrichia oblita]|uniref:Sodium/potassium-dependent atpase beta subunit n=1 Tax=Holotrichia oblita TaxID=644536 RepID=A0ACB9TFM9_HOLOL|nr:sodium/potassium-dependent atpase beta subunit [Holotrichia oblita]